MTKKNTPLNFSQLGENISILMSHCKIDATELARETGLPASTISRLRSNISDFSPNMSSLIPIARYFEVTMSQLIGEEKLPENTCGSFDANMAKKHLVPLLNYDNIFDYAVKGKTDHEDFVEVNLHISNNAFACFVQGSAMEPKFSDKTLLIVDQDIVPNNSDYVFAISLKTNAIFFRQLLTDGNDLYLKSLNPIFNDLMKINTETHKIIGPVVQARQNFKSMEFFIHQKEI